MLLSTQIESFIRARRNFEGSSHQRKHLFNTTAPFTDLEGLRFTAITNSPYDYLKYKPTPAHLFLKDASLRSFDEYLDVMFHQADGESDWCYFKIFRNLLPTEFGNFGDLFKQGTYRKLSPNCDYKIPICLIPVVEFQCLEEFSDFYSVKAACASLERTHIRLKLNSYFTALKRLLGCTDSDIIDRLFEHGVIPTKDFQLISTQKELTIAYQCFKKCGLKEQLGHALKKNESEWIYPIPKYGIGNQNLQQTLMFLFMRHPLYNKSCGSLFVDTEIEDGGKGRLPNAIPNNKRKYAENPRDQSSLPKKWRLCENSAEYEPNITRQSSRFPLDINMNIGYNQIVNADQTAESTSTMSSDNLEFNGQYDSEPDLVIDLDPNQDTNSTEVVVETSDRYVCLVLADTQASSPDLTYHVYTTNDPLTASLLTTLPELTQIC